MKSLILPLFVSALIFASCGGKNSPAAKSMAEEMCKAMELFNASDPMSSIEASSAILSIGEKTEQYGKVTEEELIEAMKKICPEGAVKYIELSATASGSESEKE